MSGQQRLMLSRALAIGGLAALLLGFAAWRCLDSGLLRPRNVILISLDTLRPDHLNHYGYARDTAGALDEFAAHSTVFENVFAPAPWTSPSTASIFTGLHPLKHGVHRLGTELSPELETLAEVAHQQGWTTIGHSVNYNVSSMTSYDQGFDVFDDFLGKATRYPDIRKIVYQARRWIDSAAETFVTAGRCRDCTRFSRRSICTIDTS